MNKVEESIQKFEQGMSEMPSWFQDIYGGQTLWDMLIANSLQVFGVGLAGWLIASWFERRHLKSLSLREFELKHIRINTLKQAPGCEPETATLLIGSVVVAHDYFRTLIIFLRKLVGGNIRPFERLVQRGRREALIRLKQEADSRGINKVINLRFTTSSISGRFLHAVEMVVYGTGVRTINSKHDDIIE